MFTLLNFVAFGFASIGLVLLYCVISVFIEGALDNERPVKVAVIVAEAVLMVLIIVGCAAYNTNTESGRRSLKSWKSETSGGLNRTVTVYDVKGKELVKYTGRFDVEESSSEGIVKIKFDCKGKRHIIYAQTGTVLIDEN